MTKSRSEAEILREIAGMKAQSITDAQALDLHLRHLRAAGRRPESIRARRGCVLRLRAWLDDDSPRALLDADSGRLAEWQADHAHLAIASMRHYVQQIQAFYDWCVRPMRLLDESPAADLTKPIERRRRPRPIPEDEYAFALDACSDKRVHAWLILGGYAGLRSIDIVGLNRDDLITDRIVPFLRVRGKGDHENLIAVGHQVLEVLAPFMQRQGAMFTDEDGRRLSPKFVRTEINDYLRRIGLAYTFHQCRHRYGTRLYEITRDIRLTQEQMRHRSVASTELYVAVASEEAVKAMGALDAELADRPRIGDLQRRPRRDLSA